MNAELHGSYPVGLLDWAGHRLGGVKRLFHATSGRPAGRVIRTGLLDRLTTWSQSLATADMNLPRVVLLVGGPGNGKTEAVEQTIEALDSAFGAAGRLRALAAERFHSNKAGAQRLVTLPLDHGMTSRFKEIAIVQDASAGAGAKGSPPAELVSDLQRFVIDKSDSVYVACVNRGVLDDALMYATDNRLQAPAQLIERVIKAVGISPDAPSCWPLMGYASVGVWPMDVESLIDPSVREEQDSAAAQLLNLATDASRWPSGDCPAGDRCPFCTSRRQLSQDPHRSSLLEILRWFELASGKRWTFRDLFSLISYLLAGVQDATVGEATDPCQWAAEMLAPGTRGTTRQESQRLAAPFVLATAQYQHALFHVWPRDAARQLSRDVRDLGLDTHLALRGFIYFLASRRASSLPATLDSQLEALTDVLDPAVADPDLDVAVSTQTTIKFRELDTRFSRSVEEGLAYIRRFKCLTPLELDVLARLDEADRRLSEHDIVNKKPAVAARVQLLLRDFACRFVRRSVGVRGAVVHDKHTLADFRSVVEGDATLMHTAAKQVEALLNEKERFVVALNTTFGESLPPEQRRAILATEKQKVRPVPMPGTDRPNPSLRFLAIGSGVSAQSIPLTFELFRSVRELRQGMMRASLPRAVVALLDTTRARLAGKVVRDETLLDGAEIRIANKDDVVLREMESFVVVSGETRHDS